MTFIVVVKSYMEVSNEISDMDLAFLSTGFSNWKDVTRNTNLSKCHMESVLKMLALPIVYTKYSGSLVSPKTKRKIGLS